MSASSLAKTVREVLALVMLGGGLVFVSAPTAYAANPAPAVVPRLQEWAGGTGELSLTSTSTIVVDPADADDTTSGVTAVLESSQTLAQTAARFRDDLEEVTGLDLAVVESTTSSAGDIVLGLAPDADLGAEGYAIEISDRITVTAPATDGAFYAGQTLLQILRQSGDNRAVPVGEIRDWSDLEYRAEHFDVSRRYMSVEDIQDEIRRAAWNKLNVIQLMFNQANAFRLYSPGYAAAAPSSAAWRYDEDDIAAIQAVADQYHVTVVPEIQNPTKLQPIAGLGGVDRSLSAECNDSSTIDFTDPAVVAWFQELLEEFVPWFSGPYVHLGNDEVPTALASCSYLTAQMGSGETIYDLQEEYIDALQDTVESLGKQAMIWVNNTHIQPSTDVLIMNFGSTSVSSTMRNLGYKVVDSAYRTGAYDRFYVAPSDYEGKVVPRGDIYAWTPVSHTNNAGQVLAMWGDDLFFSDTDYFIEMFDGRRSELGERTWNTAATTATFAQFTALLDEIGIAPGVDPLPGVPESTSGEPIHAYDFDSTFTPTSATHYPGGWNLTLPDTVGGLHGNGWIYTPHYPAAGYQGNGLRFTAAASQSLNLGGYRIDGPWTLAVWVQRTADSTNTILLRDMDYAIKLEQNGTSHQVGLSTYGGSNEAFDYATPLNEWVHLVLTSDESGTELYVDGLLTDSLAARIPLPLGGIGGRRSFGGTIDNLEIYAEALSSTEVGELYGAYLPDVAVGRPAVASSVKNNNPDRVAGKAVDGDSTTRWGSEYNDAEWLQIDLGQTYDITSVQLNWEAAYGLAYSIQVSDDAASWTTIYTTNSGDGGVDELKGLSGSGRYVRMLGIDRGTSWGYSLWDFNVYGTPTDLAQAGTATASSIKNNNPDRVPQKAIDGSSTTRWGSEYADPQWLQIDLGHSVEITGVRLNWETAYGASYSIQVSNDGTAWTTLYTTTTGDGGVDEITGLSGSGQYIRMYGTARGTSYGYSLWDFNVYGLR